MYLDATQHPSWDQQAWAAHLWADITGRTGAVRIRAILHGREPGRPRQSRLEGELRRLVRRALGRTLTRQHRVTVGTKEYFFDFAVPRVRAGGAPPGAGRVS